MQPELHDDRDKPTPEWTRPPEPPIHRAARKGDTAAMAKLLAAGADINERTDLEHDNGPHLNGLTPLMVAARSIDGATVETLRWLVEHGADIHARSEGRNTAAWYAAGHGGRWEFHTKAITPDHVERLRYLLDLGLDPRECNFVGRSLMTEACGAGDPARVALLLERGVPAVANGQMPVSSLHPEHLTAFLNTCNNTAPAAVPKGNAYGVNIPLLCAAKSGSAESVQLLLRAGAEPNTRDAFGATPLMKASSAAVVRCLLDAGADLRARTEMGSDVLDEILREDAESADTDDRLKAARAVIDAGLDVDRRERLAEPRLFSAALNRQSTVVYYLLQLGAKPDVVARGGTTVLHAACWLFDDPREPAEEACDWIIRALVDAGLRVDLTDNFGQTPMHEAAGGDAGTPSAIRTLLSLGAAADLPDKQGNTPLMIAAEKGEVECIRLLCEAGADPKRKNAQGYSALDLAAAHLRECEGKRPSNPAALPREMQVLLQEKVLGPMQKLMNNLNALTDLPSLRETVASLEAMTQSPSIPDASPACDASALTRAREALDVLRQATARPPSRADRSDPPKSGE